MERFNGVNGTYKLIAAVVGILLLIVPLIYTFIGMGAFRPKVQMEVQAENKYDRTMRVGALSSLSPFSFLDENNVPSGYEIELTNIIANRLGYNVEFVWGIDYEKMEHRLANGELDMLLSKDVLVNDVNKSFIQSDVTAIDEYTLFGRNRVDSIFNVGNAKIGVTADMGVAANMFNGTNTILYNKASDAIDACNEGKIDFVFLRKSEGTRYIAENNYTDLFEVTKESGITSYLGFEFAASNKDLRDKINITIHSLGTSGTIEKLQKKWFYDYYSHYSFWDVWEQNPAVYFTFALAYLIYLIAVSLLFWVTSSKEMAVNKARHEAELKHLAIVDALSREYLNVFLLNIKEKTGRSIKIVDEISRELKLYKDIPYDYTDKMSQYINKFVIEENKDEFLELLNIENVSHKLEDEEELSFLHRIVLNNELSYYQMKYIRLRGSCYIVQAMKNVDNLVKEDQKIKETLANALSVAEQANNAKTAFLNNMSHDIRTPMNAIIGFTSLANSHIENQEQVKGYLEKISTASNHLLSLINDVLDMSRIESGKVKIEEREVHLPEVLHELRTIALADIKAKQMIFLIDIDNVRHENILCDKLRLNQILLNMLSNAMKYTNAGGTVSVKVVENGNAPTGYASFEFHIKDTGIGMSEEFCKHIFEPFTREQTSTVSGIQGTGLGMAITKNIVDMMGGKISVTSELGKGSEFVVELQFKISDKKLDYETIQELQGCKALVVDDDVDACKSIANMLNDIGMKADWVDNGNDAIALTEKAKKQQEEYSVYMVDWIMPNIDGIETVRRIRNIAGDEKPIIFITSYDWGDIEDEARQAGVTYFCSKPIFMSDLYNILAKPYRVAEELVEEPVDFAGKSILLVEDNELNQEIALHILSEVGFKVNVANDGTEAVEAMEKAQPGQYDVILMDIQMPIMNGYEATSKIRQLPDKKKAEIPIIAMTANAFEEDKKSAYEAGMNGHVAKPIDIKILMETLKSVVKDC